MTAIISLDNLNQAKALIEKANASQLKEIINRAEALKVYAQQARRGLEIQNQCAEIKLRAEHRLGGLLAEMPKQAGARGVGKKVELHDATPLPTLKELGIEKTQSHRLQVVATLPDRTFEKHIADVKKSNKELTTAGVIKLGRQLQRAEQPEKQIPLPPGKFNVIYADPPWRYHNTGFSHSAERHYSTMPLEEICALPIADMAAKNCLLFMWVTLPMLYCFMDVVKAWGFEYITTAFVWVKANKRSGGFYIGNGNWTRSNAEICILARKGMLKRLSRSVRQVVYAPVREHSRKPDEVRDRIVQLVGDLPRVELFARQTVKGWSGWGLEYGKAERSGDG